MLSIGVGSLLSHTNTNTDTHLCKDTCVSVCAHTNTCVKTNTNKHIHLQTLTNTHTHKHTHKPTHLHTHLPVSQLCFHQSVSFGTTERWRYGGMVMCCAQPRKAVKTLAPWMRERGNSSELLSSARSGPLIMPLCRVMASCTVLSVSAQLTLFL